MYKIVVLFNKKNIDYNIDKTLSYSLEEAIEIVKQIRSQGGNAELYPEKYFEPKITKEEAWRIATKEYEKAIKENPNNLGELLVSTDSPIFYSFYCRDFEKERQGYTPGYYGIKVDKLDGHILSKEELKKYDQLNYSF